MDLQAPDPKIEMPPDRVVMLLALAMARYVRALRATKATTTQPDGTTTLPGSKQTDRTHTPGRHSRRENALVTRMGDDLQVRTVRSLEPTV